MQFPSSGLESLAARVEKLEAQNRRWKLITAILVLSGLSLSLMGAEAADRIEPSVVHAKTVEAQEFILKDQDGHVYGTLTLNYIAKQVDGHSVVGGGGPSLEFFDEKGEVVWTAPPKAQMMLTK